jgi:hypothetical protein
VGSTFGSDALAAMEWTGNAPFTAPLASFWPRAFKDAPMYTAFLRQKPCGA